MCLGENTKLNYIVQKICILYFCHAFFGQFAGGESRRVNNVNND